MLEVIISFLKFKDLLMFLGFWLDDLGMSKDGQKTCRYSPKMAIYGEENDNEQRTIGFWVPYFWTNPHCECLNPNIPKLCNSERPEI